MELEIQEYTGLQFAPALAMALFDKVGKVILDRESPKIDPRKRKLTTGNAAKAMVGTMFTEGYRKPLYRVNAQYLCSPRTTLFGRKVEKTSMSDTVLASRLDTIFEMNMDDIIFECYENYASKYGIDSNILRMDSTNFPFYGLKYNQWDDGGAQPKYCGNSKNKRNDLLHKSVQVLCDGNGIVMTSRSYSGNTSDIEMNRDTLSFINSHLDSSKYTIIADCKACVSDIIGSIIDMKMSFVTKVPNNFSELIRETIVKSALNNGMYESAEYPGRFLYDTRAPVTVGEGVKKDLRLVAYCLPNSYNVAKNYLKTTGLSVIEKKLKGLGHKRFYCENDALKAFNDVMSGDDAEAYETDLKFEVDKRIQKKKPDQPFWRIITSNTRLNPLKAVECAMKRSVSVLLTDIPFTEDNYIDPKNGKNADGVVDLYLGQDGIEKCFKIVKSGTGVAHIFIHKPSRQDAVVCLSTIATMISNVIDFVLKREMGDDAITMKHISDYMMTVIVRYDPDSNKIWMMGDNDACLLCQRVMKILGVEPLNLIGQ